MCRRSSTQGVSGWNQNLHCYCRIDINDSNTKKVTITYSDTKWHANHISSQLQASSTSTKQKIYNKSISSSQLFQYCATSPHLNHFDSICYNTKKPAHQHPKTHHLPTEPPSNPKSPNGLGDFRSMDLCSLGPKHPSDAQGRNNALAVDVKAGDLQEVTNHQGVFVGRGKVWMDFYFSW